jgi:hypothetical protein
MPGEFRTSLEVVSVKVEPAPDPASSMTAPISKSLIALISLL